MLVPVLELLEFVVDAPTKIVVVVAAAIVVVVAVVVVAAAVGEAYSFVLDILPIIF